MKKKLLIIGSLATCLAVSALAQTSGTGSTGTGGAGTSSGNSGGLTTTPASPGAPTVQPWGGTPVNPAGHPPAGTFSGLGTSNVVGFGIGTNSVAGMGTNMTDIDGNRGLGAHRFPNRLGTNTLFLPTGRTNNPEPLRGELPPPAGGMTAPLPGPNP